MDHAAAAQSAWQDGMNNAIDEAYDAWKQADAAARVLERQVSDAWRRHDLSSAAPPSRDLLRELAWLRHVAGEKLAHTIELLHDAGLIQPSTSSTLLAEARQHFG